MKSILNDQPRVDYAALLEQLRLAPDQFRRACGDRSADDLRVPGHDGGIAVVEIMCHMQDWEEITGARVSRMLHESHPELESFDDSLWSIEHNYAERDAWEALEAFTISRAAIVEALASMTPDDWQRSAHLPGHGDITIEWLMERLAKHDAKHIGHIREALS